MLKSKKKGKRGTSRQAKSKGGKRLQANEEYDRELQNLVERNKGRLISEARRRQTATQ